MPKKETKNNNNGYKEGLKMYNLWNQETKRLEKQGHYGTDYYINKVVELENKVRRLTKQLKSKKKNA